VFERANPRPKRHNFDLPSFDIEVKRIASNFAMDHAKVVVKKLQTLGRTYSKI
jgi:hypothetical protein